MQVNSLRYILLSLVFLCSAASAQQGTMDLRFKLSHQEASGKIAILIFNENYDEGLELHGPENDAKDFRELLVNTLGYREDNVFIIGDKNHPSASDLLLELEKIALNVPGKDVLLYYAGHGLTFTGFPGNYLVPLKFSSLPHNFDAPGAFGKLSKQRIINENFLHLETIILDVLKKQSPKSLVVFYNACRNGSSDNILMSTSTNIATHRPARIDGMAVFFAAGAGQQSLAGDESKPKANTLYASSLLDILGSNPTVDLRTLGNLVQNDVELKASRIKVRGATTIGHQQSPVAFMNLRIPRGQEDRGVCLVPAVVGTEETCTDSKGRPKDLQFRPSPCTTADAKWQSLRKTETLVAAFSNEFAQCPLYHAQAEQWLVSMRSNWRETQSANDLCHAVRGFLENYPDTSYTPEAEAILATAMCSGYDYPPLTNNGFGPITSEGTKYSIALMEEVFPGHVIREDGKVYDGDQWYVEGYNVSDVSIYSSKKDIADGLLPVAMLNRDDSGPIGRFLRRTTLRRNEA